MSALCVVGQNQGRKGQEDVSTGQELGDRVQLSLSLQVPVLSSEE